MSMRSEPMARVNKCENKDDLFTPEVRAEIDGVVTAVHCEAGRQVAADELMLEIEPAADGAA